MMQVCDISMSLAGSVKMALAREGLGLGGERTSGKTDKKNLILIVELMLGLSQAAYKNDTLVLACRTSPHSSSTVQCSC